MFLHRKEEAEAKERIIDSLIDVSVAKEALAEALGLKMKKSLDISNLQEAMCAALLVAKGAHRAGNEDLAKEMVSFIETNLVRLRTLKDAYVGLDEIVAVAAEHFNAVQKDAEMLIRKTEADFARLRFAKSFDAATSAAMCADAALVRLDA